MLDSTMKFCMGCIFITFITIMHCTVHVVDQQTLAWRKLDQPGIWVGAGFAGVWKIYISHPTYEIYYLDNSRGQVQPPVTETWTSMGAHSALFGV